MPERKARIWLAPNDSLHGRVWCWFIPWLDYGHIRFGWTRTWEDTVAALFERISETTK